MPAEYDIDAPCRCSASREPYQLKHDTGCRWRPMSDFAVKFVSIQWSAQATDAAFERARQERATPGPGSSGGGTRA